MLEIYDEIQKLCSVQRKQCQKKNCIIYPENKCFFGNTKITQNSEMAEIRGILVIKQGAITESYLWHWLYISNRLKVKEIQRQNPNIDTFCSCVIENFSVYHF